MLSNKKGQMTNGIYGFLSTFQKLLKEYHPGAVAVAFDLPNPTFRHKMYDKYKCSRTGMPEELASQLPILKELLTAMGYQTISCDGYEADDILGTFASYCEKNGYECILATGDRDNLQLVSKNVTVQIATTKFGKSESTLYDVERVKEEYGVCPENLVDIKALQGDTSDNIPGVKGIGEKTARELISKFGNINIIYENIDKLDIKETVKKKLKEGKEIAYISYALGKINRNVPINIYFDDYIPKDMDSNLVKKIMTDLEFFSFMSNMEFSSNKNFKKIRIKKLRYEDIKGLKEQLLAYGTINVFAQYENSETEKIFIKFKEQLYVLDINDGKILEFIKFFMECENIEKVSYDFKSLEKRLQNLNINLNGIRFDVMLAAYILSPSEKNYDILKTCNSYELEIENIKFDSDLEFTDEDIDCAKKTYLISKLKPILIDKLKSNNQYDLLINIEQPLSEVLLSMERIGFCVDKEELENYQSEISNELESVKKLIYEISGYEFNINSPKQLGFVLFDKLGLPKGKKGKNGYSTNAQTLDKLKGYHEIIDMILEYRELSKLKSTYCDSMIKLISPDGRIHSSFNQTETRTGRISSTEPNLQNIPVRTKRGKAFRKFFKAKPGYVLVDADYSQIELRVLAHIADDYNMKEAFKNEKDIHSITASQILSIPLRMITPEMRFRAKAVNFGILYGMGAFSLSQELKISLTDAQKYIDRYLIHYQGVEKYMQNIIHVAKKQGFVETMFGRRRYLPELNSSNHVLRAFGERVARNMPIQGSAADIIKVAMINVFNKIKDRKSKLILQVHDELIVESPPEEAEEISKLLKHEMENAVNLSVPLEVNVGIGKRWFDAKD